MSDILPIGKLPPDLLERLIGAQPASRDPQVILNPGIGLDCAVVEAGSKLLVCKEAGLLLALWELAFASDHSLYYEYLVHPDRDEIVKMYENWRSTVE